MKLARIHIPNGIANKMGNALGRAGYLLRKNFPVICLVVGTVSAAGAVYEASRATYDELDDELDAHDAALAEIDEALERGMIDERSAAAKRYGAYAHLALRFGIMYAKATALFAFSLTSFALGHRCMVNRYSALASAYSVIQTQLRDTQKELKEATANTQEGSLPAAEKTFTGPYTRWFDETCCHFTDDASMNYFILESLVKEANRKNKAHGFRTLNDVCDTLGLPRDEPGQVVGWIYNGDPNQIQIGLDNTDDPSVRRFINKQDPRVRLTFNVQGPIWDGLK